MTLGDPILFWILRFMIIITLIISGYGISYVDKKGDNYWYWALPSIILFSLIEGLRWNRGIDYLHYYGDITGNLFRDNYREPLYLLWIEVVNIIKLPFWTVFILYSLLYIFSVFVLLRNFKKAAIWVLPILFLMSVRQSENLIRQYLALPFLLLSIDSYLNKHNVKALLFALCSTCFHFSAIIPIFIFFSIEIFKFDNYLKTPIIPFILFTFFYFFWDTSYFEYFGKILSEINLDGEFEGIGSSYLENSDHWLTESGSLAARHGKTFQGVGFMYNIIRYIIYSAAIVGGFVLMKLRNLPRLLYWVCFIALIIDSIKGDIEIYLRILHWILFAIPFIWGIYINSEKLNKHIRIFVAIILVLFYIQSGIISQITKLDITGYAFVWDL